MIDINEIAGLSHYLAMRNQMAGALVFDGHAPTPEEEDIKRDCRQLSDRICIELSGCKEEDIPILLECYDLTYRMGYSRMPDMKFIERNRKRIIQAWENGNRGIEESVVFSILSTPCGQTYGTDNKRRSNTYCLLLDRWTNTLRMHNRFPDATTYENYQRLALIMHENLPEETKYTWYEHNRIEDLSSPGSTILRSYRRFANALFPDILDYDEHVSLDNKILEELCTRKDLNPYDRKAFRLALSFNKAMA